MSRPAQSKAAKLAAAAQAAAEVRKYQVDPDVIALRIERMRTRVDRLIWTGIVLGLAFTMTNVAMFAAGDAKPPWINSPDADASWVTAWLLDPMVSLVLIGVLIGEQVINRYGLKAGRWVRITKWVTLGCTYAMNTWESWASKDPSAILLHSVPPVIVVCAAEAVTTLRQQITAAVTIAYGEALERAAALRALADEGTAGEPEALADPYGLTRTATLADIRTAADPTRTGETRTAEPIRTDETLTDPYGLTRTEGAPLSAGERAALVSTLAGQMKDATREGDIWLPNLDALEARTGLSGEALAALVTEAEEQAYPRVHDEDPYGLPAIDAVSRTEDEPAATESIRTDVPEPTRTEAIAATRTATPPAAEVDRDAIVFRLADEAYRPMQIGRRWTPDYAALMAETSRKRSWCEKVAADARKIARERLAIEDEEAGRAFEDGRRADVTERADAEAVTS